MTHEDAHDRPAVDVHQHLWPAAFVDRLRARQRPPYLRGWTLHTDGEPAFEVDPAHHDPAARVAADHDAEVGIACLSLSAPLGVESLPRPEAAGLIAAWHAGVTDLPDHFRAWASVPARDPDPDELARVLRHPRFVGLQLPATSLLTPGAWERAVPLLRVAELADRPVLVHPGPVTHGPGDGATPGWWAPVVSYGQQLHAAWWAWEAYGGRTALPALRVVFAAAAGLAPVHQERHLIRGGDPGPVDHGLFVDSSGHGPRALDAVVRVLGIDALVLGSDRPYAEPAASLFGEAATQVVRVDNPRRLLGRALDGVPMVATGGTNGGTEVDRWAFAS